MTIRDKIIVALGGSTASAVAGLRSSRDSAQDNRDAARNACAGQRQRAEAAEGKLLTADNAVFAFANTIGNALSYPGLDDVLTTDLLETPGSRVDGPNGSVVELGLHTAIHLSAVNVIGALGDNVIGLRNELEDKALMITAYRAVLDQVGVDPDSVEVVKVNGTEEEVAAVANSFRAQGFGVATAS